MLFINRESFSHYLFGLLLIGAIFFMSTSALAAVSSWQGPYIGAYVGGGFGNTSISTNAGTVTDTSYFSNAADINAVNRAGTSTNTPNAIIGGIQIGHDWVWQQIIYGVAIDYGALSLSSAKHVRSNAYSDNSSQYSLHTAMSSNWLFTLRGRLGHQVMLRWPSLLYLTGGMAITQLKLSNQFSDNSSYNGVGGNRIFSNQIGWTAGVGIELAAFRQVSVDLEYLYVRMPSVKVTSAIFNAEGGFGIPAQSLTNPFITTGQFHASLLRLGLNYRFEE